MERALVQPEDVPVSLRALDAIIKDWQTYCEERYSIFVFGSKHECTQDTCELFSRAHQLYGCRECGNHHVCRRKLCTSEELSAAEQRARSPEHLNRLLGIRYGYWCSATEVADGIFHCRISGQTVRAYAQVQPNIQHGAMLRENARYQLEQGTLMSKKVLSKKPGHNKPPTSLSRSTPVKRAERGFDQTALSWSTNELLPPPPDLSAFEGSGYVGDDENDDESTATRIRSRDEEESESESVGGGRALNLSTQSLPCDIRDVLVNRELMSVLSRTSSPSLDRKRASDYFEALNGLMELHLDTFQPGASQREPSLEPPFKRAASAPPEPARQYELPAPVQQIATTDADVLYAHVLHTVRRDLHAVHTYWSEHKEISQEARVRTYDLPRSETYCSSLLFNLVLLIRQYEPRLRQLQRRNAPRSRNANRQRQRLLPGAVHLEPPSAVWVNLDERLSELLLRGLSEPQRLRDLMSGDVYELWRPDPFLAEAMAHGVLEEYDPTFTRSSTVLAWLKWALRSLDITPANLQDILWTQRTPRRHRS